MGRYCSDCTYLKPDDKKGEGNYKCTKMKKYFLGNNPACEKFENAYARKNSEKERLYDLGKQAEKDSAWSSKSNPSTLLIVFVLLVILRIVLYIFKI